MPNSYDIHRNKFIESSAGSIQDPPFLTFAIKFEFNSRLEPGDSIEPGLLNGDARSYLKTRGDLLRIQKLDYFKTLLKTFSVDEPWWFTSVTGLNELMKLKSSGGRLPEDSKFNMTARETVDLRFLSMMEAYRSIVIDKKYMRDMLPKNLRKFDMSIFILDQRLLLKNDGSALKYDDDSQGVMVLKLKDCEFNFDDFSGMLNTLSNEKSGVFTQHNFSINVDRLYEAYNLPTGVIFGDTGATGYYSDDTKDDASFIAGIMRPKSGSMAELGNERKIKEPSETIRGYYEKFFGLGNIEEETPEEAREARKLELPKTKVESNDRDTLELGTLDISESTREKIELKTSTSSEELKQKLIINDLEVKSLDREILDLESLNPLSNKPRPLL